jgi:hypothetical protein
MYIIIKRSAVDTFQDTLNNIDANIKFTIQHELKNKLAFLDTLHAVYPETKANVTLMCAENLRT